MGIHFRLIFLGKGNCQCRSKIHTLNLAAMMPHRVSTPRIGKEVFLNAMPRLKFKQFAVTQVLQKSVSPVGVP